MGKLFGNWFSYTSKEEKERQERIARKKAYPLGEAEVLFEEEALKKLFQDDRKADLKMIRFVAISLREMKVNSLLDENNTDYCPYEKALALFQSTIDSVGITDEQLEKINALNEVLLKAEQIEDLKI